MAGIDTLPAYNHKNISTATTTTVSTGPCVLHAITVNTTTASTITVYDNTAGSGTKIATIAASPAIGSVFNFDVKCLVGLTVVTAGASDLTVSFATL
jgi:hypothetical protein